MREQMRRTILTHSLLLPGARVLCALSGGVDSMAMTHALKNMGYTVYACHFNHGIRPTARRDQDFVRDWCEKEQIPFYTETGDVPALMRQTGLSAEQAGRQARYAFFERAMAHFGCDRCATAHHLDDQAETLLLHLSRGTKSGLNGIPYRNGAYIRPMRDVTRAQIDAYAQRCGLPHVLDETNDDITIPRNRVRHRVMPELRQINSAAAENICRSLQSAASAGEMAQRWADWIDIGPTLPAALLRSLPDEVADRVIWRFLCGFGVENPGRKQLDALKNVNKTGSTLVLSGVTLFFDGTDWRKKADAADGFEFPLEIGETVLPGGVLKVEKTARPETVKTDPYSQYFDLDKLPEGCVVRSRRPGDVIWPLGAPGQKKLKDYLIDRKFPRDRRDSLVLIARGSEIYWVCGVGASDKIALDKDSTNILHIKYCLEEDLLP